MVLKKETSTNSDRNRSSTAFHSSMIGANSIKSKTIAKKEKSNVTAFSELVRKNNWETSQVNESIRNRAIILKTAASMAKGG